MKYDEKHITKLNDYDDSFGVRDMSDDEIAAVARYLDARDEKKPDDRDFLAKNQLSRNGTTIFSLSDPDDRVVALNSTSLLSVTGDQDQDPNLPPGMSSVEVEPILLRIDKSGEVYGNQRSAARHLALDADTIPSKVNSAATTTEKWEWATKYTERENISETIVEASYQDVIRHEAGKHKLLDGRTSYDREKDFAEQLQGEPLSPHGEYSFRDVGDPKGMWQARPATDDEVRTVNLRIKDHQDPWTKVLTRDDEEYPYIMQNKLSGEKVFVGVAADKADDRIDARVMNTNVVITSLGVEADHPDDDHALQILGLSKEDLPKRKIHLIRSDVGVLDELSESVKKQSNFVELKNFKQLIAKKQLNAEKIPEEFIAKDVDERRQLTNLMSFVSGLEEFKDLTDERIRLADYDVNSGQLAPDERSNRIDEKYALAGNLKAAIVQPEALVHGAGKFTAFDQRGALEALSKAKKDEFISLQTPSGVGVMASLSVAQDDIEDSAVLKPGDQVLSAIRVKNKPSDDAETRMYAVRHMSDDGLHRNSIVAERVSQDGVIAVNAEALKAVGMRQTDFRRQIVAHSRTHIEEAQIHRERRRDESFAAQLSPAAIREAISRGQLNALAEMQLKNHQEPVVDLYQEYRRDPDEISSAIGDREPVRLNSLANMENGTASGRTLSKRDLYLINRAEGVYSDPSKYGPFKRGAVNGAVLNIKDEKGNSVSTLVTKQVTEEFSGGYDLVNIHTEDFTRNPKTGVLQEKKGPIANQLHRMREDGVSFGRYVEFLPVYKGTNTEGVVMAADGTVSTTYDNETQVPTAQSILKAYKDFGFEAEFTEKVPKSAFRGEEPHAAAELAVALKKDIEYAANMQQTPDVANEVSAEVEQSNTSKRRRAP